MSKKAVASGPARDHVVACVMRHGLNTYTRFVGPFTKAEASTYAMHKTEYEGGEDYTVERMQPLPHHEKWILRDVQS